MIKKADIKIISLIVALSLILWIFLFNKGDGKTVLVTVNGGEYGRYSLSSNATVEIKTEGVNVMTIKDSSVWVTSADCRDKICVLRGEISSVGESIICLPHGVVIEITE